MTGWAVPGFVTFRELRADSVGRRVLARRRMTRSVVSITYLSSEFLSDAEFRGRFAGEARQWARIWDSRVPRLRQYVECGDEVAVVTDQVAGTTLRALLREEGVVGAEAALVLFKDVLVGLAACHEVGLVHGDLKPESAILTRAGRVRLVDAGLYTCAGRQLLARSTPFYLAPEQWSGGPATKPGDVYAATVTFFECLAGGPPFHAVGVAALSALHEQGVLPVDAVPEGIRQLVRSGLAKNPAARPDAQRFLTHLDVAATDVLGPGWERRGRRELIRLRAGSTRPAGRSTPISLSGHRGWEQRQPVRLAGVLGGPLLLAVVLSIPPAPIVLLPENPGDASGYEGSSPGLAYPAPPDGALEIRTDTGNRFADRAGNPRSAAMHGPADPALAGRAQGLMSKPSAYQMDADLTFGRQEVAADPVETQPDQPSSAPSAPGTSSAPPPPGTSSGPPPPTTTSAPSAPGTSSAPPPPGTSSGPPPPGTSSARPAPTTRSAPAPTTSSASLPQSSVRETVDESSTQAVPLSYEPASDGRPGSTGFTPVPSTMKKWSASNWKSCGPPASDPSC